MKPGSISRRLGFGLTGAVAIALAVASAAYACTVLATDPNHDFQITPTGAAANTATGITGEGFCDVNSVYCGIETGALHYDPALRYATCPTGAGGICAGAVPVHSHDQTDCTVSSTALGDSILNNEGDRERVGSKQVVTGQGTMPGVAAGKYIVCHEYKPKIMWNIFTVV